MAEFKTDERKLQEVSSILKAVLTSFGGELPMNQIDSEYRTVVGSSIPYKELKHGTLASFLQSIPSILKLQNRGGQLVVTVVNDDNINLILQQVKQQNNKCNKSVQKKKRYTEYGTRQLHASPNPRIPSLLNMRWQNNTNWQQQHTSSWQSQTIPTRPRFQSRANSQTHSSFQQPAPSLHSNTQQPPPGFQSSSQQQPPILKANVKQLRPASQGNRSITFHLPTTQATATATTKDLKSGASLRDESQKTKAPAAEKTPGKKTAKQQLIESIRKLEADQGRTEDERIVLEFKTHPCGKRMEWFTVITIGDTKVSSYPDLESTQEEAEERASKKALGAFPLLAKQKQVAQLPTTGDNTTSVSRVKQLLKERSPNKPFWWEPLRDMYCEVYKEKLPKDWLTKLKDSTHTGLVFDNPCTDKWTVALAEESSASLSQAPQNIIKASDTATSQGLPRASSPSSENDKAVDRNNTPPPQKVQLPPISLPTTPTWNVFVTCVDDGNTIKLVLIGEQYSGMLSELQTEMELHYMEDKNLKPVKEPVVGEIYVASHEESWHRVELLEVMDDQVKVKFVDHGDKEDIPLSDLHHLEAKFFSLPPQALKCCLAGLEDAPEEPAFQALMESLPMGKTLVARVTRRQEPYAIVVFDTSTNEDINLNDKVFESLAQHLVEPSLPPVGGLAEVYLTHASSKGTVYVQVESKTYKILEDLLKIAKRRTEEMLGEKVQVDLTKLYLARFSKDGEWYRAAPRSAVDPNGQALPCCLDNVPSNPELKWTAQACQRLLDLAPPDTPLLLKVVSEGTTTRSPSVQLFKRLLPQNELVSINDTLSMDTKLFGSEGDSNNNSVEKEVVLSQVRSQQSSCTSGASSQSCTPCSPTVGPDSFPPCIPLSLNDIPDVGDYFDVFVTYAASPYHFAVQPWKMSKKFDKLNESMQNYYYNSANLKKVSGIKAGQYCAVKHTDDIWYRAQVEMVTSMSVTGIFVDFGDRFVTTLDQAQPLIPDFCTLPCLAIKAELFGIEAANKDWSPEDTCRFRELVDHKNLVSMVKRKNVINTNILYLSLLLIDTSDKTVDTNIKDILVAEQRAIDINKSSMPF
ncbi:tudor domain-containing protein 7-like isoform X2 [Portunus trituberculatus]|uniref:tudor domain-containing protein 7-like isoform X2 n=1 Tax=Portunus trituberculatus TaxID=210409 RepID=UPI001E1CE695|nr:tudor domain-containing protein 7-like isoform X2 [Portunus trituberculatus]